MSIYKKTMHDDTNEEIEIIGINQKPSQSGQRMIYIEVLRIIAMLFVIYNHTGSEGYFYFASFAPSSIKFWIYLFVTIFCAFAVPTYFAVSGAFILENAAFDKKLCQRVLKIALMIVAISLLYYLKDSQTKSVSEFLKTLYSGTHKYHLWFLYSYLAFLISAPFIKCIAKSLADKEFTILFCMCIIFQGVIPIIQQLATHSDQILLINSLLRPSWIFTNIVIYPIFGYWMHNRITTQALNPRIIGSLWISNVLCIALSCYVTLYKSKITGSLAENNAQTYFTCFTLLNLFTVFLTVKYFFRNGMMPSLIKQLIFKAGKASLWVYLFHPLVKDSYLYRYMFFNLRRPAFLS